MPAGDPAHDPAPDAEAAFPHGQPAVPVVGDFVPAGDVVVEAPADDPGRDPPQRDRQHEVGVAALGAPQPPRDQHRGGDPDDVAEPVEVHEQRADVEPVARRAGDRRPASLQRQARAGADGPVPTGGPGGRALTRVGGRRGRVGAGVVDQPQQLRCRWCRRAPAGGAAGRRLRRGGPTRARRSWSR